ncbi:MAG: hypothetical protein KAY13_01145 [Zoogloea sp.]|nr:hypothetical protein [Zoogloea sp.]
MLEIERLVLNLPAGFERRAARIGRLIVVNLAEQLPELAGGRVDAFSLPPLPIGAGWSDQRIASHVAGMLASRLASRFAQTTADSATSPGESPCSTR